MKLIGHSNQALHVQSSVNLRTNLIGLCNITGKFIELENVNTVMIVQTIYLNLKLVGILLTPQTVLGHLKFTTLTIILSQSKTYISVINLMTFKHLGQLIYQVLGILACHTVHMEWPFMNLHTSYYLTILINTLSKSQLLV